MADGTTGNLKIFGATVKHGATSTSNRISTGGPSSLGGLIDSDNDEKQEKYLKKTYTGVKSAIINHLCKATLQNISDKGNVTKYPKSDEPADRLDIKYAKSKADKMEKLFRDLDKEVESFITEDVDYEMGDGMKIVDFMKEHTHKDILFYKDFSTRKVYVVGLEYDTVQQGLHKLKVLLGKLIPTKRMQRQISDPGKEQRSSSFKSSSYAPSSHDNKPYDDNAPVSSYGARSHNAPRNHRQSGGFDDGEKFSFEADLNNGFKLKIYKASITRLEVDTIVNAANDCLMHGGGVARVIAIAAGHKLDQESRDYTKRFGYLKVGENCLTTAGNMTQYKSVIHAVGPQWHDYSDKVECMDALYDTVWNVLDTCDTKGYFSVGMSSISAGIYGVPKELCADMYVKAAVDFSEKKTSFPKELHIIDIDTSILKLVQQSAEKWQENVSIDQRVTVPQFLASHPELDVGGGWSRHNKGGTHDYKDKGHSSSRDNNYGNNHDSYGNDNKGRGRHVQGSSTSPDRNKHGNRGNNDNGGHHNKGHAHGQYDKGHRGQTSSDEHHRHSSSDIASKSQFYDGQMCQVTLGNIGKTAWSTDEYRFQIDSVVLVKVYKGSIDKVRRVDAIVCANDNQLLSAGFIANSLKKAGGPSYAEALKKMGKKHYINVKTNDVFKCDAGNLRVEFVLHVVLERFAFVSDKETKLYGKGIGNVLKKANRNKLKKLAIPLVGTGDIQNDEKKLRMCCEAFVNAIRTFCSDTKDYCFEEIHLVNNSDTVCKALVKVLNEAEGSESSSSKHQRRGSSPAGHVASGSTSTRSHTGGRGQESGAKGYSEQSGTKFKDSYRDNSGSFSGTTNKDSFRNMSGSQRGNPGSSKTAEAMEVDDNKHIYEEIGGGNNSKPTPVPPQAELMIKPKGNLNIIMDS